MKNNNSIQPNEISAETKASMKTRIISAIVGIVIAVPLIFLGDYFFFALVVFVLIVGTYEIIHCAKRKYNPALYIVAFILALLMTLWPLIRALPNFYQNVQAGASASDFRIFDYFTELNISISIFALGAFGLFFMVLIDKGFTVRDACYIFTMMIVITIGLQSGLYMRYLPSHVYHLQEGASTSYFNWYDNLESCLLIVYGLIGTFMTDAGAYFVGVFFGRHKMNERISPKKTWEGFVGGIVISSVFSFGFAMLLAAFNHPLIIGILDLKHWYLILILSLIIPMVSTLGDFVFSSVKRYFEIKDFGNLIPGHGGVLDRLDSVMFSFITMGVFLSLIQYWSQFTNTAL